MNLALRRRPKVDDMAVDEQLAADLPPIADGAHQTTSALAAKAATVGLMTCLVLGPVGAAAGVLALAQSGGPAQTVAAAPVDQANTRAIVGEFAQRVVTTWLTATQDKPDALLALVKDAQVSGISSIPFTFADPTVARIVQVDDVWSVTVAATVTDARHSTVRRFYQVPIRLSGGSVTALMLPSPVSPPPVVTGSTMDYRQQWDATSLVGTTVGQFLAAYLAGSGDVSRYLTPGVSLAALTPAPYTAVRLDDLRTTVDVDPAATPVDGARIRVLALGTATVTEKQTSSVAYALTLTARAGRWEITAIDLAPAPAAAAAAAPATPAAGSASGPVSARPPGAATTTTKPGGPTPPVTTP